MKLKDLAKVLVTTKPLVITSYNETVFYFETKLVELRSDLQFVDLLDRKVDYFLPRENKVVIFVK